MSLVLIDKYFATLDKKKKASGTMTETVIRAAFQSMLESWSDQEDLVFLPELPMVTNQKTTIKPDGTIVHDIRVPLGYWEAKDTNDDIYEEINKKFKKGYPQSNIIFENSSKAILYQDGQMVFDINMTDRDDLLKLISRFFAYQRPEIFEFRKAVEQFKTDLPNVLDALRGKIDAAYLENVKFKTAAQKFLEQSRKTINPSISQDDIHEMLIQHILTEEIFAHVFNDGDFHKENNIAKELYALETLFFTGALKKETLKTLEPYYVAIRANAAQISSHHEKQTFLKVIYEKFYKVYNPKAADRLGVVYTPNEIVKFMIEGADYLCQKHFKKALIDKGVEILDPATGTGTYICELLEYFRGQPNKLVQKYKEELHANEVAILPYYVANLNIEATYAAIRGQYAEFPNLCFVDTLDNTAGLGIRAGHQHELFGGTSAENVERIERQNKKKISVIIGNPPYNAWQENFNMRNPNRAYKKIDQRIKETYIQKGKAQNKNSVYDMYTRFFRWASDRLIEDGVLALITNRSFIEMVAYDGFRKDVFEEFSEIYVMDLGGDVRANPKLSGTKNNVFGIQTGVTISFFVKTKNRHDCKIFYARRPEMDTKDDKLSFIATNSISSIKFERIIPDKKHNWLNQTDNDWDTLMPIASKDVKVGKRGSIDQAVFRLFSSGLKSQRDEWVFADNKDELEKKIKFFLEVYLKTLENPKFSEKDTIKWDAELENYLIRKINKKFELNSLVLSQYRPYNKKYLYFDKHLNGRTYQLPSIFPNKKENLGISITGGGSSKPFHTLGFDQIPSLDTLEKTQCLPRYRYTQSGEKIDNITNWALSEFRAYYGAKLTDTKTISKDDIFNYCYGVLHDPIYREKYALNLKRDFPRIPFYKDFWQWANWGRALLESHINYEQVKKYPLKRQDIKDEKAASAGLLPTTKLKADKENGVIIIDSETTLCDVPASAYEYKLGNRSAIEWILDQYKEKKPKDPTIREKFNNYKFADYKEMVIELLMRVTTVSLETVAITNSMKNLKR